MEVFLERISDNTYPNLIGIICVPLILAILTIAFPLLSSSWERIQNKYRSRAIAKEFNKETTNIILHQIAV